MPIGVLAPGLLRFLSVRHFISLIPSQTFSTAADVHPIIHLTFAGNSLQLETTTPCHGTYWTIKWAEGGNHCHSGYSISRLCYRYNGNLGESTFFSSSRSIVAPSPAWKAEIPSDKIELRPSRQGWSFADSLTILNVSRAAAENYPACSSHQVKIIRDKG